MLGELALVRFRGASAFQDEQEPVAVKAPSLAKSLQVNIFPSGIYGRAARARAVTHLVQRRRKSARFAAFSEVSEGGDGDSANENSSRSPSRLPRASGRHATRAHLPLRTKTSILRLTSAASSSLACFWLMLWRGVPPTNSVVNTVYLTCCFWPASGKLRNLGESPRE